MVAGAICDILQDIKSFIPLQARVFEKARYDDHRVKLVSVLQLLLPPFPWLLDAGRDITGGIFG